jgi:hypothetical protein
MHPYGSMTNPYTTNPHMLMMDPYHFLMMVRPLVEYGLKEAEFTSKRHAMTEVALIAYLMGMGYDMHRAHGIVESWEIDEKFPHERME